MTLPVLESKRANFRPETHRFRNSHIFEIFSNRKMFKFLKIFRPISFYCFDIPYFCEFDYF